ncbi:hypothetical protein C2845_PM01G31460 [Panicum miliaceum]|uniref:Uncharacterized protein n=1 Tax=Panicum miliaceum TaxID=4540 RepID=A0A3L6TSJ9_PANMI|nr:hypothetical protein C2845_PM01G31460 [Panicum miliaceum]
MKDARSLRDRVLFLGYPTSFAVDAPRYGSPSPSAAGAPTSSLNSRKAGLAWRDMPEACRVYMYSFEDGSATVVEELRSYQCRRMGHDNDTRS